MNCNFKLRYCLWCFPLTRELLNLNDCFVRPYLNLNLFISDSVWFTYIKDLQNTLLKSHEQYLIKYVIDFFESWIIGLHNIHTQFTRDILAHNIAIKRYCDKNIFFEPWISMSNQGKLLMNHKSRYFMFCKELTLAKRNQWIKNIFLSQYSPSKCLVWIRP